MDYFKIITLIFMILITYKIFFMDNVTEGFADSNTLDDWNAINALAQIANTLMANDTITLPGQLKVNRTLNAGDTTVTTLNTTGRLTAGTTTVGSLSTTGTLSAGATTVGSLSTSGTVTVGSRNVGALLDSLQTEINTIKINATSLQNQINGCAKTGTAYSFQRQSSYNCLRGGDDIGCDGSSQIKYKFV